MADEKLNLYQKLSKIRKMSDVIKKNKKGFGYTYVTEDEILARVTAGMEKYGVSLIPKMIAGTTEVTPIHYLKKDTKTDKAGNVITSEKSVDEYLIVGQIEWHWVNDESPDERVIVPWMIIGQQSDASQTFGSAWTYSSRYFLMKYFNIATSDDDPDNYKLKKAEAAQQEERAAVEALVAQIDAVVQENVNDTNTKALKQALLETKAIKVGGKVSANYNSITNMDAAQTVLAAVKQVFGLTTKGE